MRTAPEEDQSWVLKEKNWFYGFLFYVKQYKIASIGKQQQHKTEIKKSAFLLWFFCFQNACYKNLQEK